MTERRSRYRAFERFLTFILFIALAVFLIYLMSASLGALALKIICAVLVFLLSAYGLWSLYASKELLKPRSFWLTCAFGSLILLTVVSLLCNFPRP